MKKIIFFLMMAVLFAGTASAQGYEITVKFKNLKAGDTVILGHHFNEKLIPDDTVTLNSNGVGVFKKKEALPGGMYFIFMPNRNYFDILLDGPHQKFTIENDTTKFLQNMVITGSPENEHFRDYQIARDQVYEKYHKLQQDFEAIKGNEKKEAEIRAKMQELSSSMEDKYKEQITNYPNEFFSTFLTATRDPEIPASITDQTEKFFWYKAHYFDNFPVSDQRLLRTAIYQPKIEKYIDNMCPPVPDSLIRETGWLIDKTRHNDELFRFMLVFFFNKYAKSMSTDMYSENVYVSLAEIYCKDAKWDTDSFKTDLKKKITRKANCLVGNISKEIEMRELPLSPTAIDALRPALDRMKEKGVEIEKQKPDWNDRYNDIVRILDDFNKAFPKGLSVHNTPAKYKIVVFWEPDCSHCKEEIPKLFDFYRDTLSHHGVKVFAVMMQKGPDKISELHRHVGKWFDFVKEKQFFHSGWYNLYNPFDQYRENYDVSSTPTFYLLSDKNEILLKRISPHQMYEYIQYIEKQDAEGKK